MGLWDSESNNQVPGVGLAKTNIVVSFPQKVQLSLGKRGQGSAFK